jgi:hypothetical protein
MTLPHEACKPKEYPWDKGFCLENLEHLCIVQRDWNTWLTSNIMINKDVKNIKNFATCNIVTARTGDNVNKRSALLPGHPYRLANMKFPVGEDWTLPERGCVDGGSDWRWRDIVRRVEQSLFEAARNPLEVPRWDS